MNNEFKPKKFKDTTVYTLESATSGGTSTGGIASVSGGIGGVQRRKPGQNLIAQEGDKAKVPASKPRNFVAKNATTGGAGAHKDKKKAAKQGDVKHKARELDMAEEASPMIKPPTNRFDNKHEAFAYAREHGGKVFRSTYIDPNTGNKNITFVVKKNQGVAEGLDDSASATPAKNERGRFTAWDDDEPMRLKCEDGEFRTIQEINMLRQKIGMKPFSIKGEQGMAEGAKFGAYYSEKVAQEIFNKRQDITSEDEVLNQAYHIVSNELGQKTARYKFNYDEDFSSDVVSNYFWLKKQSQGVEEELVGQPQSGHPGQAGQGSYSAAEHTAKTQHRLGSHTYTVTSEQDNDGDFYYFIYENGEKVFYGTEMDSDELSVHEDKLGPKISSALIDEHKKATAHLYNDEDDYDDVDEGGYAHGFADPNAPRLGQRQRDYDRGEDEPQGMFAVVINGRPWKEFTSNKAFQVAKTIASKNPDKKVQVRWPNGTLNGINEDHSTATQGYGQGGYDTYANGRHGRGVAENPEWYNDEANGMTTAQLKSLVKHAAKLRRAVKAMQAQGDTLEPWQQSKVTKAADYLDAVFNAVDDNHDMGESAPKGWEGTVKAMKKHKEIDNPYALTNWMKNKGYKSHKKEDAYMEQLAKQVAEKLNPSAPVDVWVQDFQKADPNKYHQFKNKTPEKKARMAAAAHYAANEPSKK